MHMHMHMCMHMCNMCMHMHMHMCMHMCMHSCGDVVLTWVLRCHCQRMPICLSARHLLVVLKYSLCTYQVRGIYPCPDAAKLEKIDRVMSTDSLWRRGY